MAKYIDADPLRKEIMRLKDEYTDIAIDSQRGWVNANSVIDDLEQLQSQIDSLQQEQPEPPKMAEYYYHKGVYEGLSQGRADALKILEESMKTKAYPVIVMKQQEQPKEPSEDLEEEIINYFGRMPDDKDKIILARHFAKWGAEHLNDVI